MHSARAVQKEIVEGYANSDLSVHVVWVPMLPSDSEAAAREEAALMGDSRVRHYWDPERRSGTAYAQDVFPGYVGQAAASLPSGHFMREHLASREGVSAERAPLWDIVFFYEPGSSWGDSPPKPDHWTKQFAFYGNSGEGPTGLFWRNDFGSSPADSDWFDEIRVGMEQLTGGD